jgi:multidrug resistance protein MdtO
MQTEAATFSRLLPFLRRELAPRPGRAAAIARISVSCTLVGIVWMVFRIPEPAYAVYVVFLVSGSDAAASLMTGVAGVIAATFAIALSIILYALDASEPALRVPIMALATFLGMYLSRTITAGPVAFLLGFLLVITQTISDVLPNTEALTRFLLWLWLVAAGPAVLTVLVDLWGGPNPGKILRASAVTLLDSVSLALRDGDASALRGSPVAATAFVGLRKRAGVLDRSLRAVNEIDSGLIETLDAVVRLASTLPAGVSAAALAPLHAACVACRDAVAMNEMPSPTAITCASR